MGKSINSIGIFLAGLLFGITTTGAIATTLGSSIFSDVEYGSYYDEAVGELNTAGIINGYGNGKFGPNDNVTRGQVAVLMKRLRDEFMLYVAPGQESAANSSSSLAASTSSSSDTSTSTTDSSTSSTSSTTSTTTTTSFRTGNEAGLIRFTIDKFTVDEDEGSATVTVVRTGGKTGAVTVDYTMTGGTATAGDDFELVSGSIRFSENETSSTFLIRIKDDEDAEGDETINIAISNPNGGAQLTTPNTAVLTIIDNEESSAADAKAVAFSATAYAAPDNGGSLNVKVVRTGDPSGEVKIDYATTHGTATSSNYTPTNGTLTFADGETEKTISIDISDNTNINGNKTFNLDLSNPVGTTTPDVSALVTIIDDEVGTFGSGSLKFYRSTYTASERSGIAIVEVSRVGGTSGTVSADYKTDGGTAVVNADYEAVSGTITFGPGESRKSFTIPIIADDINDSGERINVKIMNPVGTILTSPTSSAVIIE